MSGDTTLRNGEVRPFRPESMSKYRLVWFQHLHKAAGTYVIRRAKANGEIFYPTNENGNPCDEHGVIPLWEMSGSKLTKFIDKCEDRGVTFVATEWGGPDFDILSKDPRVCLITCIRDPINRFISNFNFDYYWMWSKSINYDQYLSEKAIHTSPNYYIRIFSRNHNPTHPVTEEHAQIAKENTTLFDKIIVAETGMNALDELGWEKESDTKHPTFGDRWAMIFLFKKLRFWRLFQYITRTKHEPPNRAHIEKLNKFDIEFYHFVNTP